MKQRVSRFLLLLATLMLPMAMWAQSYQTLPYAEGFENPDATTQLPAGWVNYLTGSSSSGTFPQAYPYSGNAHSGNRYFELESSTGQTEIAATCEFANVSDMMLDLYYCINSSYAPATFEIGVMEDSTFVLVETVSFTTTYSWNTYTNHRVYFNTYTGNGTRIAFRCTSSSAYTVFMDDMTFSVAPSCSYFPGTPTVASTDSNQATIRWSPAQVSSGYTLHLANDDSWQSTIDTFYTFTSLTPNTYYTGHVFNSCTGADTSEGVAFSFRTDCGTPVLPLYDDLDTYGESFPSCWTQTETQGSYTLYPYVSASNSHSGSYKMMFYGFSGPSSMASPLLAQPINTLETKFWIKKSSTYYNSAFAVGYVTDLDSILTAVMVDTVYPSTEYAEYTVSFRNVSCTEPAYIVYRKLGVSGDYGYVYFDDVTIRTVSNCVTPTNFHQTGTAAGQVSFAWTDTLATDWQIGVGMPGCDPDTITAIYDYISDTATVTGLNDTLTYDFYLRANCGSDYSYWLGPITARPNLYVMTPNANDTVHMCGGTIVDDGGLSGDYSGYQTSTLVVYPADNTQRVTITGPISLYVSPYGNYGLSTLSFYEGVGTSGTPLATYTQGTDTVNVSSGVGPITIYFNSQYYQGAGYALNVSCSDLPDCPRPTNLALAGVGSNSVTLSWSENGNATTWDVYYDTVPMDSLMTGTVQSVTTNPATITNLTGGVYYNFYVRADCGGEQSEWYGPITAAPNTYTMRANQTDTVHMCGGVIYDDGGVNGNYTNGQSSTLVLYPTDTTMGVSVSGTLRTENLNYDYLVLYDGVGVNGTVLYSSNGLSSSCSAPITISNVAAPSGVMTIYFTCDNSVSCAGYELSVSCFDRSCPAVDSLTLDSIGATWATLSWTAPTTVSNFDVQYHTTPFEYGDSVGTHVATTSTHLTINNLTPNTHYYFAVASDCGASVSMGQYVSGRTLCEGYQAVPYVENFEGYALGDVPGCWDNYATGTSWAGLFPSVYEYSSAAHGGNNFLEFEGSVTEITALPSFDSLQYLQLEFYGYANAYGAPTAVEVGVMEDSTFVLVSTVPFVSDYSYHPYTVYFGGYTGSGTRPAIRVTGSGYTVYLDDLTVSHAPTCLPVTSVAALGTTSNSVTIGWNANGSTAWNVVYDTVPIADFTGYTPTAVTTNPATITGLTMGESYYFYVQSDCGGGDVSTWEGGVRAVPGSWNMRANQTDTVYMCGGVIYDDGGADGDYSDNQTSYLVIMPDAPLSAVSVTGHVNIEGYSWDNMYIYDGIGTSGTELVALAGSSVNQTVTATSTSGPLTIYFYSDGSGSYSGWEFNVSCVSNTCPAVSNIRSVASSTSSLSVAWDTMSAAMGWQIEWGESGFAQGNGATAYTTDFPYTINGLDTLTAYDVYVRPLCTVSDSGQWAMATIMTSFCDGALESNLGSSTSGASSYVYPVNNYYGYTLTEVIVDSVELASTIGTNAFSSMSLYYVGPNSSSNKNDVTIWLQPTTKSAFSDISDLELLDSTTAVQVYSGPLNCNVGWNIFAFDTDYVWSGHGNLMVIFDDNSDSYDGSNCKFATDVASGYQTLVWYSDYYDPTPASNAYSGSKAYYTSRPVMKLTACGVAGCARPYGLAVSNVTYDEATLHWNGSADSYEVSYKAITSGSWSADVAVNNGTTYTFQGLQPNTEYQLRVRSVCEAGQVSEWMLKTVVTDELPCFEPTGVQATAAFTSVTSDWTPGSNESYWAVRVWNTAFDSTYTAAAHPFTAGGLNTNVTYNIAVRSLCGANGSVASANWSDTVSVTTQSCDVPTGVNATVNDCHSATVTWTPGENNTGSFVVEYGQQGFASGNGQVVAATSNSVTLTGLSDFTTYDVYVRANCESGAYSTWSTKAQFRTPECSGIAPVDAAAMSIHPNPAAGLTTISLSGVSGSVRLTVVDMNGRTVRTEQMTCDGSCQKVMDVEDLAAGAYFVRLQGDNLNTVKKLIIK